MKSLARTLIGLVVLSLVAGCQGFAVTPRAALPNLPPASTPPARDYWPTQDWRTSTPEQHGMDAHVLAQMVESIEKQALGVDSVLVIRHGYIVTENYFSHQPGDPHDLFSCTKSFVSALVGIAMAKGAIKGVNQPVLDFFPDRPFDHSDARKRAMTLENLLTMTSGLDWTEGDPVYAKMVRSPDWLHFVLDKPMVEESGSRFNYCSGCSHVLSAIVQASTGTRTVDFAQANLFRPLGITHVTWQLGSGQVANGGWGLALTSRDMAKLGYLYLNGGVWDGQQIVPAAWVKTSVERHVATGDRLDYGYQWWVYPALDAYTARGRGGQLIFVIPRLDMVVVFTADLNDDKALFDLIETFIVPAARPS